MSASIENEIVLAPLAPRRPVTVNDQLRFRESIATPPAGDEIEELLGDLRRAESENSNHPHRL